MVQSQQPEIMLIQALNRRLKTNKCSVIDLTLGVSVNMHLINSLLAKQGRTQGIHTSELIPSGSDTTMLVNQDGSGPIQDNHATVELHNSNYTAQHYNKHRCIQHDHYLHSVKTSAH